MVGPRIVCYGPDCIVIAVIKQPIYMELEGRVHVQSVFQDFNSYKNQGVSIYQSFYGQNRE